MNVVIATIECSYSGLFNGLMEFDDNNHKIILANLNFTLNVDKF